MNRTLLLFVLTLSLSLRAQSELVINELMQSNIDCIMDDLNQFPDSWVELYNPSELSVSLRGYALGVTSNPKEAYKLPDRVVPAGGYLLVYCDKENTGLHTHYRLESGKGCEVHLFHNAVEVDSVVGLKKQPAPNISYGRQQDAADKWGYQAEPSPAAANTGIALSKDCLPDPVFSLSGRVFTDNSSHTLTLSIPEGVPEETIIRYTTDGSEPTMTNGSTYSSAFTLEKSTVVRAKLMCPGYLSPRACTQSYIFHTREMTLPIVSIVTDDRYLFDEKMGIYVVGSYNAGRKNYEYDWRRPINLEFFEQPLSEPVLNQLCETRIQGGGSRSQALKSFALYANKRFGEKRLQYEFFPDQRPGVTDFKSLLLRNAGNDFDYLYMRDALIQRSVAEHVDLDWQAWRPAILYINGVYFGIENIRERSNEDNIYTHYAGLEDITMMENEWDFKTGRWSDWEAFRTFYSEPGHTWEEYEAVMDCHEYINLMIMNLFYNNQDFPGNNIVFWRPLSATESLPARWRWIAKDTDFGLGLYGSSPTYDTMSWLYDNSFDADRNWANEDHSTILFRNAMNDSVFRREFIDRAAIYIGDFLNLDAVWPLWESMYEQIREEYPIHRALYNPWWPNYQNELNAAKDWLRRRPPYFLDQLRRKYALGNIMQMSVDVNDTVLEQLPDISLTFNGVPLSRPVWKGKFYCSREVVLEAAPAMDEAYSRYSWVCSLRLRGGTSVSKTYRGATCRFTIPDNCTSVDILLRMDPPHGLHQAVSMPQATKIWRDGQIVICRDNQCFNLLGELIP